MAAEPRAGVVDVVRRDGQPPPVPCRPGLQAVAADPEADMVPEHRTEQRADGPRQYDDPELEVAPRHRHSPQRDANISRGRRKRRRKSTEEGQEGVEGEG